MRFLLKLGTAFNIVQILASFYANKVGNWCRQVLTRLNIFVFAANLDRLKGGSIYKWLRRNDSDWLEKHLPKSRKLGNAGEKLNWNQIDLELCEKVQVACKEIKSIKELPVRISIAEIIKRVGKRVWLDKRHEKLPLTKKMIGKNSESWEDFMLRKVKWAKEFFIKSNKAPTPAQFKYKASLRNHTSFNSSKVQKAMQNALNEIKFKLSL